MTRASWVSCLVLVFVVGCGLGDIGFGPFPSSGLAGGQLTAGVAGFVPDAVPQEGEFPLLIVNTDSQASHTVRVTPLGGLAIDRTVGPCNAGTVAVACDAATVLIELMVAGSATPVTLTIIPVEGSCTQRVVYIGVPFVPDDGGTGGTGGDETSDEPPTLTETVPASAAACGLGGLPDTSGGFGGFGQ